MLGYGEFKISPPRLQFLWLPLDVNSLWKGFQACFFEKWASSCSFSKICLYACWTSGLLNQAHQLNRHFWDIKDFIEQNNHSLCSWDPWDCKQVIYLITICDFVMPVLVWKSILMWGAVKLLNDVWHLYFHECLKLWFLYFELSALQFHRMLS